MAVELLHVAPSTAGLTADALRNRLKAVVLQAALDSRYREYPTARPSLADLVVPTAIHVEAGWDRRAPAAALINHLRITDLSLDAASADVAGDLVARLGVSVGRRSHRGNRSCRRRPRSHRDHHERSRRHGGRQ